MSSASNRGWGFGITLKALLLTPWRLSETVSGSLRWRGLILFLVLFYLLGATGGMISASFSRFHPKAVEPALLLPVALLLEALARSILVTAVHSPLSRLNPLPLIRFYWLTTALFNMLFVLALAGFDAYRQLSGQVVMPSVQLNQILGMIAIGSWVLWTLLDIANFRDKLAPFAAHLALIVIYATLFLLTVRL